MNEELPIHEVFTSFQGEGIHAGRKAFFIRTMGCPLHCPWCDSAGTWHKDYLPALSTHRSINSLVASAKEAAADFVVLTGGEPCIHKSLPTLCDALQMEGIAVHLETSGAYDMDTSNIDWVTVSPKRSKLPTANMLTGAHELKIIIDTPTALDEWWNQINAAAALPKVEAVLLHPEWSRRNDKEILDAITSAVVKYGFPFRAGYQLHKLFLSDSLDPRAAQSVPLGGNPTMGPST